MATNEQTLGDLLNSVIQGEASDDSKAECLSLALKQVNINITTIRTLLGHGADPYFSIPQAGTLLDHLDPYFTLQDQLLPVIFSAVQNISNNVECLKLLLEYQGATTDEDLDLKTDEQNHKITEEHQNQKTDENPDHNSENYQHQQTYDDPNQKTDDHQSHKTDENEDQKTDENEDQKTDENEDHKTDDHQVPKTDTNKEQEILALAADATCLTTETKSRKIKAVKQNLRNKLLLHASAFVNYKCVTYLLEKGACVNYHDVWGNTPLVAVCSSRQSDEPRCFQTVDILLNHGANVLARGPWRRTALHCAADRGFTSVINRLLAAGCDVNMQDDDQCTPLIVLVRNEMRNSKIEAIKNLLKFGAKIEYANDENNSRSALFHAVLHNEVVELLLLQGADPDFVYTPFLGSSTSHTFSLTKAIAAIAWNNVTAVKLFIQYNCDVNSNARDRDGKSVSAFRLAARHKNIFLECKILVICKMLALAGCDRLEMNECVTEFDSKWLHSAYAHLWQEVKAMASSPFTLEQLSRLSIRHNLRNIGRRIMTVSQLFLPKYLQEYLMFKELDNYIDA